MRTTHVTRGEERLTSVPLHLQLFQAFGITPPLYCHLPLILKLDNGKKRKISKRYDPEFNIQYLYEAGYSPQGLIMFVMTLIDSGYEHRQKTNPTLPYTSYKIDLQKMNSSGALRDTDKLKHINNLYLSSISNQQLFDEVMTRATNYHPALATLIQSDPDYALAAISSERHTDLDPKRFSAYADVDSQIKFFFDEEYKKLLAEKPSRPDMMTPDLAREFVSIYTTQLDLTMTKEERFTQLKEIGKDL
jgi:glutamyl-tRNA synthetase